MGAIAVKLIYVSKNEAEAELQCHCRECQYITGGNPNAIMIVSGRGFRFTKGTPASFAREDLTSGYPIFCATCGAAIGTRSPARRVRSSSRLEPLMIPPAFERKWRFLPSTNRLITIFRRYTSPPSSTRLSAYAKDQKF